jgi:hypothetical protein
VAGGAGAGRRHTRRTLDAMKFGTPRSSLGFACTAAGPHTRSASHMPFFPHISSPPYLVPVLPSIQTLCLAPQMGREGHVRPAKQKSMCSGHVRPSKSMCSDPQSKSMCSDFAQTCAAVWLRRGCWGWPRACLCRLPGGQPCASGSGQPAEGRMEPRCWAPPAAACVAGATAGAGAAPGRVGRCVPRRSQRHGLCASPDVGAAEAGPGTARRGAG